MRILTQPLTRTISAFLVASVLLSTVLAVPGLAQSRDEAGLEDPGDHDEDVFFARRHMSDTEALNLQKADEDHRVETETVGLSDDEIKALRSKHRVRVFTDTYTVHKIYRPDESEPYRYAVPIQQPGQHEFMDLMYSFDPNGTVNRIDLVVYREPYGGEIQSRRFMQQFEDRSLEDSEFRINYDVVHISGATISTQSVAQGTRKLLGILEMKGYFSDR